ncbi:DUF2914 domain-containing protein [Thermodesulfobacteriota bacterium]
MKKVLALPCVAAVALLLLCLLPARTVLSQEADTLDVGNAVICRDVINRKPVGAGTNFPASVGKLYCFSEIAGARRPTTITHVWYYGNTERTRVTLPVKHSRWRTSSSKIIRPHETGVWHVDILDALGNKLEVLNFQILKK